MIILITFLISILLQGVTNINCIEVLSNMIFIKHFFTNRVVSLRNSLPNGVVDSDTINCFERRLDKFLNNQDFLYNWEADFAGTGNRSIYHTDLLYVAAIWLVQNIKYNIKGYIHESSPIQ